MQHGGQVTVYDTLDHQIGGVQQQQGGPYGSQSFTSQFGTFTVDSLPVISGGPLQAPAPFIPSPQPTPFAPNVVASSSMGNEPSADLLATLERLGTLRDKGIVSEQEFQAKKAELLSRL